MGEGFVDGYVYVGGVSVLFEQDLADDDKSLLVEMGYDISL